MQQTGMEGTIRIKTMSYEEEAFYLFPLHTVSAQEVKFTLAPKYAFPMGWGMIWLGTCYIRKGEILTTYNNDPYCDSCCIRVAV